MELNSLALEACIGDTSTYFGRIPRDIVRLVDSYITEPVRIDLIKYDDQNIQSLYEDRVLTKSRGFYCVRDIRGNKIARWKNDLSGHSHTLISREEILICTHTREYTLYNFISGESRVLTLYDTHPPNGSTAIQIYPHNDVYYEGAMYNGNGLRYFQLGYVCHARFIKIGENSHAPVPTNAVDAVYRPSGLTIFRKLSSMDFEFCGHQIKGVSHVHEALNGVIYIDSEMKLKYMGQNGISKELNYDRAIFPIHTFGEYVIAYLGVGKSTPTHPYCFARLRTW